MKHNYNKQNFTCLSDSNIDDAVGLAERYLTDNGIAYEQKSHLCNVVKTLLSAYR